MSLLGNLNNKPVKEVPTALCPAQQEVFGSLLGALKVGDVLTLWSESGLGRSTILRALHHEKGGKLLTIGDFVDALKERHPLAIEETFTALLLDALHSNDLVLVDDLHLLTRFINNDCSFGYPRPHFIEASLEAICSYARNAGKKLVVATSNDFPGVLNRSAYPFGISKLEVKDYEFLCKAYLGRAASNLDFAKIHRFAPRLNAHQLRGTCLWLKNDKISTDAFIDYLRSQQMVSNVDLGEVQAVDLRDLKGVDDVIESLEANMVLPLENEELATELDLKPKRGVLLAGPPGTGKTTVGRALAHRLKSKFFLVDGTFISGSRDFYEAIHGIFERAKENAPCIIFIDDSDVIFETGKEQGLYRYLLTMLDGIESQSMGRVCVMLTAMNVANLPPALLRSGRVELWLEMRLPNEEARHEILQSLLVKLPSTLQQVDFAAVVEATEGFTGADLKRLIEDAKTLYAFDKSRRRSLQSMTEYLLAVIDTVRENKQRYMEADAIARSQQSERPPWFDVMGAMMGAGLGNMMGGSPDDES